MFFSTTQHCCDIVSNGCNIVPTLQHCNITSKWQISCLKELVIGKKGVGYVVVQFYPWFKFSFLLFLDMVMYDNEFETKENKI